MGERLDRILSERGLPPVPRDPSRREEPTPAPAEDGTNAKPAGEVPPPSVSGPEPSIRDSGLAARDFARRIGAQPGNQNARKHGLYSKYLAPKQRQDYDAARGVRGVEAELALFRCKLAEMLETEPWNWILLNRITNTILRLEAALPPEPQENKIQVKVHKIIASSFIQGLADGDERVTRVFNEWMEKNHGGGFVSENESHVQPEADSA